MEEGVEPEVERHPSREIVDLRHPIAQCRGVGQLPLTDPDDGHRDRERLELLADLSDLLHVVPVELPDHATPMAVQGDESFGREIPECLTDRGRADAQLRREVCLDESRPAGQIASEDGLPEGFADELVRRPPLSVRRSQCHA